MADVFISYSSEDRERIVALAAALEQRGLSVWWDRAQASDDNAAAEKAMDAARAVIVAWSARAVSSPFVRSEALTARNSKKLAAITLDGAQPSAGLRAINAINFSAWDGNASALEVDQLHAAVLARLQGKPLARAFAWPRLKDMRIRLLPALVAAGLALLVVTGVFIFWSVDHARTAASNTPSADLSRFVGLVRQGKITGEQALAFSQALQARAFADVAVPTSVAPGAISSVELDDSARSTFVDAAAQLLQDPNPELRAATLAASTPATRESGLETLWEIAAKDSRSSGAIYRYIGAIGVLTEYARVQSALERARDANPQDRRLWRLLSAEYARKKDAKAAKGAALVGEGLAAAAAGKSDEATSSFDAALPLLSQSGAKAFVLGQMGDAAAKRDDWSTAEKRYRAAVDLHAQGKDFAGLAIDAPKLARAQSLQGDNKKACATLTSALRLGVETVSTQLAQACDEKAPSVSPRPSP